MSKRKPYKSLNFDTRRMIEEKLKEGKSTKEIADAAGVHIATIYREVKRGQTEDGYKAIKAQCTVSR